MIPIPRPVPGPEAPYHYPAPVAETLENGLVVETFDLDRALVPIAIITPGGPAFESLADAGLDDLLIEVSQRGTAAHPGDSYVDVQRRTGGTIYTQSSYGRTAIATVVAREQAAEAAELLAELVIAPELSDAATARTREHTLERLRSVTVYPGYLAQRAARRLLFEDSERLSVGRLGTEESVAPLTAADLRRLSARTRIAQGSHLLIGGRLDAADDARVRAAFAGLGGQDAPDLVIPTPPAARRAARIHVVDRPDAVQSEVRWSVPAPPMGTVEHARLTVGAQALGGSIGSRLSARIREEKGYTYGIYAGIFHDDGPGVLTIGSSIDVQSLEPALTDLRDIVADVVENGLSPEETERSKDEILRGAALRYQSTTSVVEERIQQVLHGRPASALDAHRAAVAEVDTAAASQALAETFGPDRPQLVLVGPAEETAAIARRVFPGVEVTVE